MKCSGCHLKTVNKKTDFLAYLKRKYELHGIGKYLKSNAIELCYTLKYREFC